MRRRIALDTDPEDEESDKIKTYVAPYESGDVEEVLDFVETFRNLIRLKALEQNGPVLFQHARLLLREEALATFISCHEDATEALADREETETEELFSTTFEDWMT
jgi:hypothetical protein